MSWRDSLRKASFRGVEFWWADANTTLDPMVVVHKYPQRRGGWTEGLGLGPDEFEIVGYVLGDDYMLQRDRLIRALKQGGPGTLVHPTLGEKTVVLSGKPRIAETTREGGMARFTLVFTEEGENRFPEEKTVSTVAVMAAAEAARQAVAEDFAASFDTAGQDLLISDAATALGEAVAEIAGALKDARDALSNAFGTYEAAKAGIAAVIADPLGAALDIAGAVVGELTPLAKLIAFPLAMVGAAWMLADLVMSFFGDVAGGGVRASSGGNQDGGGSVSAANGPTSAPMLMALSALSSYGDTAVATDGAAQDANRSALATMIRRVAAITTAEVAAASPYDSRDDAIAARDMAARALDNVRIGDGATGEVFASLTDLRAATVKAVNAQAGTLASVRQIETAESMSATQLAWRELSDATRAGDVVARNRAQIWNPLFVPAGATIEVIDV